MTMTHKEAIKFAQDAYYGGLISKWDPKNDKYMEAAIRAYIEARGLVLVPKEITTDMKAAYNRGVMSTVGYISLRGYSSMLAAAPDPFEEGE